MRYIQNSILPAFKPEWISRDDNMDWNYPHMALIFAPWYTKVRKTLELYILKERAYSIDITDDYQNIYEAFHHLKDMFEEIVN